MNQQIITIKFDNEEYTAQIPVAELFTGSVSLTFHFFQGKPMKSEVQKSSRSKTDFSLSTGNPDLHESENSV